MRKPITKDEARRAAGELSRRFGVAEPRVLFLHRRLGCGRYYPPGWGGGPKGTISLCNRPDDVVLAHEFAHHLHELNMTRDDRHLEDWHGRGFYHWLRNTIAMMGLDGYPWEDEYENLKEWATAAEAQAGAAGEMNV